MSQAFDPYFKWLGIPPQEQPPNHYRLLGIPILTADADVIENAGDQRMAHVRTFGGGQHAEHSQRLLNELAAAKVTLLSPEKKAAYDAQLRSEVPLEGPHMHRPAPRDAKLNDSVASTPSHMVERSTAPVIVVAAVIGIALLALLGVGGTAAFFVLMNDTEVAGEPVTASPSPDMIPVAATQDISADDERSDEVQPRDDAGDVVAPETDIRPVAPPPEQHMADEDLLALAQGPPPELPQETAAPKKAAVPDEAARKAAQEKVTDVLGEEISQAKTPAQKRALAVKIMGIAARTKELPVRFVLYRQAIDLAEGVGDAATAFEAVDRLDESFEGDALRLKASVLHSITNQLRRGDGHVPLAQQFGTVLDSALAGDRFDIAQPLTEVALQSAIKSGNADLRKLAVQRVKEVEQLATDFNAAKAALTALQTKPTDPAANLVAGKYYCFSRGDWQQGLPYLALAEDAHLKKLADEELSDAPDSRTLGDGWWKTAEGLRGRQALNVQRRAAMHYRQLLPTLTGFDKATVEKRLSKLPAPSPVEPRAKVVDLIAISDPAKHGEKGRWRKVDGALVGTNLENASFFNPPYSPPREYDLEVSFTRTHNGPKDASDTHVRLPHGTDCHVFGVRTMKDGSTSLSFWGDKPFGSPPMGVTARGGIPLGARHTLLFRVRDAGVQVMLDGKPLFKVDDYALLRKTEDGISLGSFQNQTVFHKYTVREVAPPASSAVTPPGAR